MPSRPSLRMFVLTFQAKPYHFTSSNASTLLTARKAVQAIFGRFQVLEDQPF